MHYFLKYNKYLCKNSYLCIKNKPFMSDTDINRIKLVLVEKKKTNKWLAEKLGKDQTTISKWCTNSSQPDINNLMKISKLLDVNISELLRMDNCEICKSN